MLMYKLIIYTALFFSFLSASSEAFSQKKKQAENSFFEILRQYQSEDPDKAIKTITGYLAKNPESDAACYYLSNLYLRKGDSKNALKYIEKACQIDTANYWYLVQTARLYTQERDYTKAAAIYDKIKKEYPQKTTLYDDLIELYVQQKDYAKAVEVIDEIEKIEGKNEATVLTRFNIEVYQGKADEARQMLEEYDKESGSPRSSTILGDLYLNSQNDSLAKYHYDKALSADPSYSPARFGISEYYRMKRQYDLYFENINPFLADSNIDPSMKVSYIKEILKNGQFVQTFLKQVDTMMQNIYTAHPKDSSIAYEFAGYLYQTGNSEEAVKVLQTNILNYPNEENPYKQYLILLYYQELWDDLCREASYVLEKFPGSTDIMELKGIGLIKTDKPAEAIKVYKEIVKEEKGNPQATINPLAILGDLYYQTGNKKLAFEHYEKVLKLDPKNVPTLNNYAYYLSLEDKGLQRAYDMSKITIDEEPNNPTYLDTFAWILYKMEKYLEAKAIFKHAMLYGGKENADILDHYAETLFKLKEYDLAFIYWDQAKVIDPSLGIEEKISARKKEMK